MKPFPALVRVAGQIRDAQSRDAPGANPFGGGGEETECP
jgi:hypothetical protein